MGKQSVEKSIIKKMSFSNGKEGAVGLHKCLGGPKSELNETKAPKSHRGHDYMSGMIF